MTMSVQAWLSLAVAGLASVAVPTAGGARTAAGVIAYSSGDICLVRADGTGERCVTHSGNNYAPISWSADGLRLAFERVYDATPGERSEVLTIGAKVETG
jgi:hypothetical protein